MAMVIILRKLSIYHFNYYFNVILSNYLGDALGIYPQNNPHQVQEIMTLLQFSGKEMLATPSWAFRPCNGKCIY